MEIRKDVCFEQDVTVEVNPEDVLDEMTDAEIKSYYKDRFEQNLSFCYSNEDLKYVLSTICTGRCPRNLEYDNATIRKTINEIMDQVLY